MKPKITAATCLHYTPTGRRSRRAGAFAPGLPAAMQGLCKSCLGAAMVREAVARQAETLSHKIAGDVANLLSSCGLDGGDLHRAAIAKLAERRLAEMGSLCMIRKRARIAK